jgi:tocopherol cyclase
MNKNQYKLTGCLAKKGYDWWWHSFVGRNMETGELKPFFVEYYVINPGLWKGEMVFGQLEENRLKGKRPCYAMIKAGSWGNEKAQLHNFFPVNDVIISKEQTDGSYDLHNCFFGEKNLVSALKIIGSVSVSQEESSSHPEYMTDAGSMKWDVTIDKKLSWDVGYGSSGFFSKLKVFKMFWHIEGLYCEYEGVVDFNGKRYLVERENSYGYQDKNWGSDYTNPWIWLNCNSFISKKTGQPVRASLDVGGGCPVVLGIPLKRKILTAFYYDGKLIEFNFSKFWKYSRQKFDVKEDDTHVSWEIVSENKEYLLEIKFSCEKQKMLLVNYENPMGKKKHNRLWNGGHATGNVKLYRNGKETILIDELLGSFGGCEYGEY